MWKPVKFIGWLQREKAFSILNALKKRPGEERVLFLL